MGGKSKSMSGRNLSFIRHVLGVSQFEIGKMAGVCQAQISNWETEKAPIPPGRVRTILRALKLKGMNGSNSTGEMASIKK